MQERGHYPKKAGIYKLICNINNKIYIGKSINIYNRLATHKSAKDVGYLYNAIRKYGWDSFEVEILEVFESFDKNKDNDILLQRESYYIKLFKSTDRNIGYNRCGYSNDSTGIKSSDETIKKLKSKTCSAEHKRKISISNSGKIRSEETREKISKSRIGMKFSEKTKEKMRMRRHTDETKEKIRTARLGSVQTEETKEKIRASAVGKLKSEKTKQKMRKPKSEQHRENIRLSWIKRKQHKCEKSNTKN